MSILNLSENLGSFFYSHIFKIQYWGLIIVAGTCWKDRKIKHQWQKRERNPHVKNKTGLIYPYNRSLKETEPVPLSGSCYRYIGSSNEQFNHNQEYYIMRVEYVWFDVGLYIVLTKYVYPNEYVFNDPIDIPLKDFYTLFEQI